MANEDFIKMAAGDAPSGKNNNSTFNGRVLTVGADTIISNILEVRVAASQSQSLAWDKTINPGSPLNSTQYTFNGSTIQFIRFYSKIQVKFEKEISQAQFEAAASPEMIAFQQKMLSQFQSPMKATAEKSIIQNQTGNSSPFNSIGATFGGFKGLVGGAKPTKDFISRPRIAQLLPGAVDGSADKTSTKTTELTTLFKKTGLTSTGNLNKTVFTQGSVNSIIDAMKTHTTAPSTTIETNARAVLPASVSVKVIEQATAAITDKNNNITLESKVSKDVKTETKAQMKEVRQAGIGLDPTGILGGAGRSGTNILANLTAKVKGITGGGLDKLGLGNIKNKLPGLPDGVIPPAGVEVPNLIEGFDPLTGKQSFNTNVSKLIQKGKLTPNMSPANVANSSGSKSDWTGYSTPNTYKFEIIQSVEQLEDELENSSRFKSNNNAVVAIIVGWSDKMTGPPEKVNAQTIHAVSKASDEQLLIKSKGDLQKAINEIKKNPKLYGIQSHFVILTDGRIQKGRPIDEVRNPDTSAFDLTGVQVTLVANNEQPASPVQMASLNKLISKIYQTLPGVNVFGDNDLDDTKSGPGFDMSAIRDKYGKTNTIENPEDGGNGPTRKEIAYIKPKEVAKGNTTIFNAKNKFSFSKLQDKFENIDPETGNELPADHAKDAAAVKTAMNDVLSGKLDINSGIAKAVNDPKNSLAKQQGDSIVKKLIPGVDKNKSFVDTISKKLDIKNLASIFGRK